MQIRNFAYHDLDSSQVHNRRAISVIKPGVYKGYRVRRNAGDPSRVDITHGTDGVSVLMTSEGIRVQETGEIPAALQVSPADPNYYRYDLVVAEYQWSPNNAIEQTYKVIRGSYPPNVDDEPSFPVPENSYQIPLAYLRVRPLVALSGLPRVNIEQSDILHYPMAEDTLAPDDLTCLKPVFDPTDRKRIFVYQGKFPTLDGVGYIDFPGGYSEEIDSTGMVDGETKYFLFGVSDDGLVDVVGTGSTPAILPDIGSDVLPICVAKVVMRLGSAAIEEIIDVRFPFARRLSPSQEEDFYQDFLNSSVFKYLKVDTLKDESGVVLDTLLPSDTNLTAKVNRGETSLEIHWAGTTVPGADVTIATADILLGTELSGIRHIMVTMDSDIDRVTFDYSTTSSYGGFTGRDFQLDEIQELSGGVNQLFLKFKFPASNFPLETTKRVFSFAVFMTLDYEMLNAQSLTGLGLDMVGYSTPPLLPNGDFRVWSRAVSGAYPDIDKRDKISYPISVASFASRKEIYAADSWQFTKLEFDADNRMISRVLWSRDVLSLTEDNTNDTALEWKGSAGTTGSVKVNHLECRVPVSPEYEGQFVTFAVEFKTNPREAFGIRIVLYERTSDGSLAVYDAVESGASSTEGTLVLRSGASINRRTYAIGFSLVFTQALFVSAIYVRRARAAIGSYQVLPFTRPANYEELCRKYYERGSVMSSASVEEGEEVGAASQFGSVKLLGLSEGVALKVQETGVSSGNRSVNVGALNFTSDRQNLLVRSTAAITGLAVVDVDWEAFVVYPPVS